MCKKYEVLCFCETKTDHMDIPDLTEKFNHMGFQVFKNRHNLTNWRSGGVMIAVKKAIGHKCVQRALHSDACVCVQMNKNMLNYEKDLVILAAYVPPYMSRYSNSGILDDLTQVIIELSVDTNYILVCGDMNAHTNEREDWIIDEEEIDEEEYNEETVCTAKMLELADIPLRRKSVDICKDYGGNGSVLLDMCKNLVLCIINGRCGEDKYVGKATSTDHTVIDYMIVSLSTLSRIKQCYVHDFDCLLSDKHCVVELVLGGNNKDQKVEPVSYNDIKSCFIQDGLKIGKECTVQLKDFYEHFKSLADSEPYKDQLPEEVSSDGIFATGELNGDFTEEEVVTGIASLKVSKAAGIDKVLNEYIKSTARIILPVYVKLFNMILSSGVIPRNWVTGLIVPVYEKNRNIEDCNNYRVLHF
ncbi:hypothetical protein ABVT39_016941 [Epinephelus coioides]